MEKIVIEGGARLTGEVTISGAKNAALPLICATILAPGRNILTNVPRLGDVRTVLKLLAIIGADVDMEWPRVVVDTTDLDNPVAPYELVKTMRAAILVLGPLVARYQRAKVSLPGGCAIGARPINLHLKALEAMGARIEIKKGYVEVFCERLKGAHIQFPVATVGGTENIMMAATLADGVTTIENAAREPEIVDLANMLNAMGAKVEGAGSSTVTITGVESLSAVEHQVIPDRIEAGTFMIAAAITGGEIRLHEAALDHLEADPPDLLRVVFNPAGARVVLGEVDGTLGPHLQRGVDEQRRGAGGSLVDGEQQTFHGRLLDGGGGSIGPSLRSVKVA